MTIDINFTASNIFIKIMFVNSLRNSYNIFCQVSPSLPIPNRSILISQPIKHHVFKDKIKQTN